MIPLAATISLVFWYIARRDPVAIYFGSFLAIFPVLPSGSYPILSFWAGFASILISTGH